MADRLGDDAVVAEDDVVEVAARAREAAGALAVERVVACLEVVAHRAHAGVDERDGELARDHVDVDAVVAVDQVDAALAADRVVAGAAREVVAALRADDRVVARAAVGDDADVADRAGRRARVRRGVDHVVAGEDVRARDREEEARRAVADLGRERLGAEVADRLLRGSPLYQTPSCEVSP